MEVTVRWEWDNNRPRYPWVYHVRMGSAQETGYCNSLSDCFDAVDMFVSETIAKAIQEAECQRN